MSQAFLKIEWTGTANIHGGFGELRRREVIGGYLTMAVDPDDGLQERVTALVAKDNDEILDVDMVAPGQHRLSASNRDVIGGEFHGPYTDSDEEWEFNEGTITRVYVIADPRKTEAIIRRELVPLIAGISAPREEAW